MPPSFFSWATPNITTVIPVMDHLDQHLTTSTLDLALPASIHAATTLGKHTLNKYYIMTDHSEVYQIVMDKFHYICTCLALIYLTASPASMPQAWLLQDGQAGQEMDWCCKTDSMWQDQMYLHSPCWCWLDNMGQWWTQSELKEGMLHPTLNGTT